MSQDFVVKKEISKQEQQNALNYWTQERIDSTKPMEMTFENPPLMKPTIFGATFTSVFVLTVVFIVIVDFVLKGFALWKAAKLKEKNWFIALFILNTAGILPAIYLIIKRKK